MKNNTSTTNQEIKEEWRQLVFRHQLQDYDVSNLGRIRKHSDGMLLKLSTDKEMTNAYEFITLKLKDGTKYNTGIHRLVALMFIPIPKEYLDMGYNEETLTIDHNDSNKRNNRVTNLQWMTRYENTMKKLRENYLADIVNNINIRQARQICELLAKGLPISVIASDLEVSEQVVKHIKIRKSWKDVSKNYEFPSKHISVANVKLICEYLAKGYTIKHIAEIMDLSEAIIAHIRVGDTWTEISKDYIFPKKLLSDEDVIEICEILQNNKNVNIKEIAKKYDVKKSVIERIRRKETYTDITKNYTFEYSKFKVSDEVVENICKEIVEGVKLRKHIAEDNGVSLSFVKDLKAGKLRTDISSKYGIVPKGESK